MRFLGIMVFAVLTLTAARSFAETHSFGVVPQFEPRKLASIWMPILKELGRRTGHAFVMTGSLDIPDFEASANLGKFDFAYMNPYQALQTMKRRQYFPLVRNGSRKLQGILVVRKDSPLIRPGFLDGKKVAFPSANALGASVLMRSELRGKFKINIQPVYVQTHSSVYLNVILGETDAGGGVLSTFNKQKPAIRSALKIIYKTRTVPPHAVMAHSRVSPEHRGQVLHAFLEMSKTEGGRRLLERIPMSNVVAASIADYQPMASWGLEKVYIGR
jgi:phosphonate transport system substrate-binding protein